MQDSRERLRRMLQSTNPRAARALAAAGAFAGLLVSFLPWYGVTVTLDGASRTTLQENGWHGFGWLAVLLYLLVSELLLLPLVFGGTIRAWVSTLHPAASEARLTCGAGLLAALAVLLFMFSEGHGLDGADVVAGPSYGAVLGLLCALSMALGGYLLDRGQPKP